MYNVELGSKIVVITDNAAVENKLFTTTTTYKVDYKNEILTIWGLNTEFNADVANLYGYITYTGLEDYVGSVDDEAPEGTTANFQAIVVAVRTRLDKIFADAGPTLSDDVVEGVTNLYYTEARVNSNTNVAANTSAKHSHSNDVYLDTIDQQLGIGSSPTFNAENLYNLPTGGGDMLASTYDPLAKGLDVYSRANHIGTIDVSVISDLTDTITNHADVSDNTSKSHSHDPVIDTGSELDLSNPHGGTYYGGITALTNTVLTIATGSVIGGFAIVRSNCAVVPVITGALPIGSFNSRYIPSNDNLVKVWKFSDTLFYYSIL